MSEKSEILNTLERIETAVENIEKLLIIINVYDSRKPGVAHAIQQMLLSNIHDTDKEVQS